MKKISRINEGWGAMIRRDITSEIREEDNNPEYKVLHNPEWVDMGTGVLWRNFNLGASSIEDTNFKYVDHSDPELRFNKKYPVATDDEYEKLIDECIFEKGNFKDRVGLYVTAQNGNVLFFDAAGVYYQGRVVGTGIQGYYWSISEQGYKVFVFHKDDEPRVITVSDHKCPTREVKRK